jgi:hypothetical protein
MHITSRVCNIVRQLRIKAWAALGSHRGCNNPHEKHNDPAPLHCHPCGITAMRNYIFSSAA